MIVSVIPACFGLSRGGCRYALVVLLSVVAVIPMQAVASEEEQAQGSGSAYVRIVPSFILNYQARGQIRHLRTDITIRVSGDESVAAVEENIPLIKSALVLLISKQDQITVSTPEGRFSIRQAALEEVRAVMEAERPEAEIMEVLFTNFFVE